MGVVAAARNSLYHTRENGEGEVMPQFERYSAIYYYSPGYAAVTNARFVSVRRESRSSNRSIWITP